MKSNSIISPQIIGSARNKAINRKITVLSFYLEDGELNVTDNILHREILELFVDGHSTRTISKIMRTHHPDIKPLGRRNAVKSFGHEGISRIVNRYFDKAVTHYKEKYETTK